MSTPENGRVITFGEAVREALAEELRRDERVFIIGEDVVGGRGGTSGAEEASGGAFGVHTGLIQEFGKERIIDTPITESAIMGAAGGAGRRSEEPASDGLGRGGDLFEPDRAADRPQLHQHQPHAVRQ